MKMDSIDMYIGIGIAIAIDIDIHCGRFQMVFYLLLPITAFSRLSELQILEVRE